MIECRVIAMEHPTAEPGINPGCTQYCHSKFVRRRKYVDDVLLPQIRALAIDVERFTAIIDTDFSHEGNQISYKDFKLTAERGIVGCYLTHAMLWRLCIERACTLLILEDDASLPQEHESNVVCALAAYVQEEDRGDILYLLGSLPYLPTGIHRYPADTLTPVGKYLRRAFPIQDMSGTAAYAIKPAAAAKLLERVNHVPIVPVDEFLHGAAKAREVGILVPEDFTRVFMLHEHFAEWNHVHQPGVAT